MINCKNNNHAQANVNTTHTAIQTRKHNQSEFITDINKKRNKFSTEYTDKYQWYIETPTDEIKMNKKEINKKSCECCTNPRRTKFHQGGSEYSHNYKSTFEERKDRNVGSDDYTNEEELKSENRSLFFGERWNTKDYPSHFNMKEKNKSTLCVIRNIDNDGVYLKNAKGWTIVRLIHNK